MYLHEINSDAFVTRAVLNQIAAILKEVKELERPEQVESQTARQNQDQACGQQPSGGDVLFNGRKWRHRRWSTIFAESANKIEESPQGRFEPTICDN